MPYPTYPQPNFPYPEGSVQHRIIDFAMNEFFAKGIRSVTMDDIAHGLQMSKRTLYQLFEDKEQLVIACSDLLTWKERRMVLKMMEDEYNVLEVILRIIEQRIIFARKISPQYFKDIAHYSTVQQYILQQRQESLVQAEGFLSQGIEQGLFRPDVNFHIVLQSIFMQFDQAVSPKTLSEKTHFSELFINIGIFHLRGCCTPKGICLVDEFLDFYRAHHSEIPPLSNHGNNND